MPDLAFHAECAEVVRNAAVPTLGLKLRIDNAQPDELIHSVLLRVQVHIEAPRRRYSREEEARLYDLFGDRAQWSQSLRSLHWTQLHVHVPSFTGRTELDLLLPCTFDFNVAATKYFAGLEGGDAPLQLLFSGTIFYAGGHGGLQVTQIPWEKSASFRLPVDLWQSMMDRYYPDSVWLRLSQRLFDRLRERQRQEGLATWEQALEQLLAGHAAHVGPGDEA